jgi:hypothetical protein
LKSRVTQYVHVYVSQIGNPTIFLQHCIRGNAVYFQVQMSVSSTTPTRAHSYQTVRDEAITKYYLREIIFYIKKWVYSKSYANVQTEFRVKCPDLRVLVLQMSTFTAVAQINHSTYKANRYVLAKHTKSDEEIRP